MPEPALLGSVAYTVGRALSSAILQATAAGTATRARLRQHRYGRTAIERFLLHLPIGHELNTGVAFH